MKAFLLCSVALLTVPTLNFAKATETTPDQILARIEAIEKENALLRKEIADLRIFTKQKPKNSVVSKRDQDLKRSDLVKLSSVEVSTLSASASRLPLSNRAAQSYAEVLSPCAATRWQGLYAGLNAGGTAYTANRTNQDAHLTPGYGTWVQNTLGFIGGGQVGYNFLVTCNLLFGFEVDGNWSSANATTGRITPNPFGTAYYSIDSRFNALVTGRMRAGIAIDRFLVYLTGGVAAAHLQTLWSLSEPFPSPNCQCNVNEWGWGGIVGLGAEWAWSDRVSVRTEMLYFNIPDRKMRVPLAPGSSVPYADITHSDTAWIGRIGINVKLGDPVFANY